VSLGEADPVSKQALADFRKGRAWGRDTVGGKAEEGKEALGKLGHAEADEGTVDLRRLAGSAEPLILCGHGNLVRDKKRGKFYATTLGRLTVDEIYSWLRTRKLPKDYRGTIYLMSCHSSTGGDESLAARLLEKLRKKGYKHVSTKGNRGVVLTGTYNGETIVAVGSDETSEARKANEKWADEREAWELEAAELKKLKERRDKNKLKASEEDWALARIQELSKKGAELKSAHQFDSDRESEGLRQAIAKGTSQEVTDVFPREWVELQVPP